MHFTKKQNNI